jgi:hypothetical protein
LSLISQNLDNFTKYKRIATVRISGTEQGPSLKSINYDLLASRRIIDFLRRVTASSPSRPFSDDRLK